MAAPPVAGAAAVGGLVAAVLSALAVALVAVWTVRLATDTLPLAYGRGDGGSGVRHERQRWDDVSGVESGRPSSRAGILGLMLCQVLVPIAWIVGDGELCGIAEGRGPPPDRGCPAWAACWASSVR